MNIYLCGFMGCGKSRIGKLLAKNLGYAFADLDSHIEKSENMTIPEIFEKYGEPHFRTLEAKYICEMPEGSITALGGGAILNAATAAAAHEKGKVVLIDTPFDVCYDRIKDDPHRPIAASRTKEQLEELYNTRRPVYEKNSVLAVDGSGTPEKIASAIAEGLGLMADWKKE